MVKKNNTKTQATRRPPAIDKYNKSVNETLKTLRKMDALDFQDLIIEDIFGGISDGVDITGIDGYAGNGSPVQVKRSDNVGKNVVKRFVYDIQTDKKKRGYIVAFSFTNTLYGEVATIKKRYGIHIVLKTVEELLRQSTSPMIVQQHKFKLIAQKLHKIIDNGFVMMKINGSRRKITSRHLNCRGVATVYYIKHKKTKPVGKS